MNPNPYKARQAARKTAAGTVKELSSVLWRAIGHLETHLDATVEADEVDTGELCKLTHALSQAATVYLKALEAGEVEAQLQEVISRLDTLEAAA